MARIPPRVGSAFTRNTMTPEEKAIHERGLEMAAYDALPREVQIAINESAMQHSAIELTQFREKGYTAERLVDMCQQADATGIAESRAETEALLAKLREQTNPKAKVDIEDDIGLMG